MKRAWVGIILVAGAVARAVGPGSVDPGFAPELRAPAVPDWSSVAPDGRVWIAGGFDRADGAGTGDLLRLGADGGIAGEPAPGLLFPSSFPAGRAPFPLASGGFLLPSDFPGWLLMNADGTPVGPAFPGLAAGDTVIPKWEREGKLWVIREHADASSSLERRLSADGSVDAEFSQGTDWPDDVLDTAPSALGGAWVLTGDHSASSGFPIFGAEPKDQHLFLVHGSGAVAGEMRVLSGYRPSSLSPRAGGGVIVVLGADYSRWLYWPQPDSLGYTIQWRSPEGEVERSKDFSVPIFQRFVWAEGEDGSLVVTGTNGGLVRYDAAGVRDESFHSPGKVRQVAALPGGKWLVDGMRRLNADGTEDATWTVPDLDRPARLKLLEELPDARVLAVGDFDEVDGVAENGLALFTAEGSLDTTFTVDVRVGVVLSAKASGDGIYLATQEPVQVRADLRSNLVRLHFDGSLDETFTPPWSIASGILSTQMLTIDGAVQLDALADGDLMVTSYGGQEVPSTNVSRLLPDGSKAPGFSVDSLYRGPEELVPLAKGGFARGGVLHEEDGTITRDLSREGSKLDPLAEWQGGVLFYDKADDSADGRLRLFKGKRWVPAFTSQRTTGLPLGEPGERKQLYLAAAFNDGDQSLRRLTPEGKLDRTFRSARYTRQARREAGDWWIATESGKEAYDPAKSAEPAFLSALLWHAASGRLWVAGDFNMIDGQARDGLAWIAGGKKTLPDRPRR